MRSHHLRVCSELVSDDGRVRTGFDIVGFGHKDGLIGAYCVAAVNALARELKDDPSSLIYKKQKSGVELPR